jgi:hypothetical protein
VIVQAWPHSRGVIPQAYFDGVASTRSRTTQPSSLRDQFAGEPAGILDQGDADAVVLDPVEQGTEAQPALQRIGAAHRGIVEPIDHPVAGRFGAAFDREPLDVNSTF